MDWIARRGRLTLGLVIGLVAGGGVAWAAIPNSNTGEITACYKTSGTTKGLLRVIDHQGGARCNPGEATLTWKRGFRWRGAWSPTSPYTTDDVVAYAGSSWVATRPNMNRAPSASSTYWATVAQRGSPGPQGPPGPAAVTIRTASFELASGRAPFEAIARCQPGEVVTGGGHDASEVGSGFPVSYAVEISAPVNDAQGAGWRVRLAPAALGQPPGPIIDVFALCAPSS